MVTGEGADPPADGFEVGYLTPDGAQVRVPLADAWAVRLESAPPARSFASYKGQRHLAGCGGRRRMDGHVGYRVVAGTRSPDGAGLRPDGDGDRVAAVLVVLVRRGRRRRVSHAPDFFARRADGSAVVVDCRPVERRKPRDVAKFDATAVRVRRAGVGVPAGRRPRPDRGGERAVAGRLPASTTSHAGDRRGAAGGVRSSRSPLMAGGEQARRPDRGAAGAVPPAVAQELVVDLSRAAARRGCGPPRRSVSGEPRAGGGAAPG